MLLDLRVLQEPGMPAIQFGCPRCGATAQIDSSMIGRETQCPGCGNQVPVIAGPPLAAGPPPVTSGPPPMPGAPPRVGLGAPPVAVGHAPPIAGNRPPLPGGVRPVAVGMAPPRVPPVAVGLPGGAVAGAPPVARVQHPSAAPLSPAAVAPTLSVGAGEFPASSEPEAAPIGPAARGKRPLRKLSPEEKAQRRLRRNIVMAAVCLAILLIAMSLLIKIGG
jgi:DNA-directed RNA polymerase subunit RPC12/RpoP